MKAINLTQIYPMEINWFLPDSFPINVRLLPKRLLVFFLFESEE